MKPSTKDEIKSKFHELRGILKEKTGRLTNNPRLKAEGKTEKIAGKVQRKIGQMKRVIGK